jgi:hypothetical protein
LQGKLYRRCYSVQEQLQQLVETNLRVWLPAREFLQQVFEIQVIDRSMELVANILQQGMVGKLLDLASFLFRTHIMSHMDSLKNLHQAPELVSAKRRFMEGGK